MQIKFRKAPVRFAPMGSDKQQSCLSSAARTEGDDGVLDSTSRSPEGVRP